MKTKDVVIGDELYTNVSGERAELGGGCIERARTHGERAGREDYLCRAADVASGAEPASWAWPSAGADEAYLNAISTKALCAEIEVDATHWEDVRAAWLDAFRAGYEAAHGAGEEPEEEEEGRVQS